jgi:hypothetical protein
VVLADVLHLIRSGGAPVDLERYPPSLFPYAQVCGAVGAAAAAADVAVLRTCSVARVGRDDVWKLLQGVLHRRQAHPTDNDDSSSVV